MAQEFVSYRPHGKFSISHETITMIEKYSGTKITKNMDTVLRSVFAQLED